MPKGQPNKRYTPEFKIKVVETMHREKLSYRETARQFDICDHDRVAAWERIYLEEGAEGLYAERRGRKSTGRPPKIKKEDLIAEVQRLRAENVYLKKLNLSDSVKISWSSDDCFELIYKPTLSHSYSWKYNFKDSEVTYLSSDEFEVSD